MFSNHIFTLSYFDYNIDCVR